MINVKKEEKEINEKIKDIAYDLDFSDELIERAQCSIDWAQERYEEVKQNLNHELRPFLNFYRDLFELSEIEEFDEDTTK